jgi:hypothetical protein
MRELYNLMEGTESKTSKRVDAFLLTLIFLNVLLVIVDSYGKL